MELQNKKKLMKLRSVDTVDGRKYLNFNQIKIKFKVNKIKIISDLYDFINILYIFCNLRRNDKACLDIFR